jgi:hypothetical protein
MTGERKENKQTKKNEKQRGEKINVSEAVRELKKEQQEGLDIIYPYNKWCNPNLIKVKKRVTF